MIERWKTKASLLQDWDTRTEQISRLIDAESTVIEFGAGRQVLRSYLPDGCVYTPSDLVDRGNGTVICDLNSDPLPDFDKYDFAVFGGVLEYVNDVPRLILHLSNFVDSILASYAVVELNDPDRKAQGWVNKYSSFGLIKVFRDAGFQCHHIERWWSHLIHRFDRRH